MGIAIAASWFASIGCNEDPQKVAVDPCTEHPCNVAAVVTHLGDAYTQRDYAHFARLLHDDYLFTLHPNPNDPSQPTGWGKTEELRIHRRMLAPQTIPSTEEPLPEDLWLMSANPALTATRGLQEEHGYDQSESNPTGLNPAHWKAWSAEYDASALFKTRGETGYSIDGRASFVVVQDLTKAAGDQGAFLLYRWQDLGPRPRATAAAAPPATTAIEPATWGRFKGLYR